jgi:hypothetical protein
VWQRFLVEKKLIVDGVRYLEHGEGSKTSKTTRLCHAVWQEGPKDYPEIANRTNIRRTAQQGGTVLSVEQPSKARLSNNLSTEQPCDARLPTNPVKQGYRPTAPSNPARGQLTHRKSQPSTIKPRRHDVTSQGHARTMEAMSRGLHRQPRCHTHLCWPVGLDNPIHRGLSIGVSTVTHAPEG